MRRRTFIQTLPLAAAASAVTMQSDAAEAGQSGSASTELPKFQPADAERFIRPDVHAGDRPSGASFATRSPALGLSGAAGTAHPLATQTAIEMLKRGGSAVDAAVAANAVLGFVEPVSSGLGGDCFAFVWDPKVGKLMGMASSGRSPKALTLETVRARDAAISSLETHLEIDAGAAIVNWYAALISAVVEALKTLITNAGAIVADVANANLRDQVSSDLSQYLESASAGKAITDEANAFNLLFAALGSANSMGFTQFDIAPGPAPDHTLQFRLTYPPPAKPKLENAAAASNKELHLVPPTIGTGGQQVKPGVPFLVNGSNFLLAYTDELDIDWGQTVAGVAKSQLQWGLKDGTMQTVPVDMDNFKATNLKPSTAYQFRVQECDAITCSPWSDWLEASTESSGSGIVKLWLDNNTSQPIGTAPLGPNGGFAIKATIPAGTAPGTHTINAAPTTGDTPVASAQLTVAGGSGVAATIAVINTMTHTAFVPPINLLDPSTFTLRGDGFAPGVTVTLYLDTATGTKLGTTVPDSAGSFQGNFNLSSTSTGTHQLVAVQGTIQASEEVDVAAQPK